MHIFHLSKGMIQRFSCKVTTTVRLSFVEGDDSEIFLLSNNNRDNYRSSIEMEFNKLVFLLCILVAVIGCGLREVGAQTTEEREAIYHAHTDRILLEGNNNTKTTLTLRTERVDPLNDLKKYKGGYNITNKHYWSSTVFTGKFGYIIAALWIVAGLIYAAILLISNLCINKRRRIKNKGSPSCTLWPIIFGLLFTIFVIVASGVTISSSTKFHSKASAIKNIISEAVNEASGTLSNVSSAVQAIQNNTQFAILDGSSSINSTLQKLNADSDNIQRKAEKSMHRLSVALRIMNLLTIIMVSLNLIVVLALLASGPLFKFRRTFLMLIILCWVLTFLFWFFLGFYYFLDKFAGDTCVALDEYRQDPRNSTLSSILPCNNQISAERALHDVGEGIYDIVDMVNQKISGLQSSSLSSLEYICNPFSAHDYSYQPDNCSSNTIQLQDVPKILKMYTCNSTGSCKQGAFISASDYNTALVYTNSIQTILDAYPVMETLVDCQLVKNAFSKILFKECRPLKKYVHMTWATFATLSTLMTILLLTWMIEVHHGCKNCPADSSIRPNSTTTDTFEVETSKTISRQTEVVMEA